MLPPGASPPLAVAQALPPVGSEGQLRYPWVTLTRCPSHGWYKRVHCRRSLLRNAIRGLTADMSINTALRHPLRTWVPDPVTAIGGAASAGDRGAARLPPSTLREVKLITGIYNEEMQWNLGNMKRSTRSAAEAPVKETILLGEGGGGGEGGHQG